MMKKFKTKTTVFLPLLLSVFTVAGLLLGMYLNNPVKKQSLFVYPRADKISTILNYIQEEYVDTVNRQILEERAIVSILQELDPHSVYIPAKDLLAISEPLEGNFEGIGVQFNMPEDTVVIINTVPGGPSERVGIEAGDRIVTINDTLVAGVGIPQDEIVRLLKGRRGSKVRVGIQRRGVADLLSFEIVRDRIPLYSVDIAYMVNDDMGYIKISKFARTTFDEFLSAVKILQDQGMKKLVVDLRGNSGGYMDAATRIADQFLPAGRLIVYTEGRARPRNNVFSTEGGCCPVEDIAILIDEFSASASEILAGAIQDNDRGLIIGRRSFGKGLVQEPIMLSDGSAIRLTIARYYTPTGRSIQKPYENGSEEYYNDWQTRYIHGEFTIRDSIHFDDALRFTTSGGKVVYGGGGIMPDIFVPYDTTGISDYFVAIRTRGLIYRYAFLFTDRERKNMMNLKGFQEIDRYLDRMDLLSSFVAFAKQQGIQPGPDDLEISGELILTQLKAYIARNMIDNEGFYPIIHKIDETFRKATMVLSSDG